MRSLRPSAVGVVIYAPSPYPRRWTSPVCSFPSPNLAPPRSENRLEFAKQRVRPEPSRPQSSLSRDQPGTLVDAAVSSHQD
jgi:hypothetical protein